ncbi:hypothetical protein VPH13_07745 [Stenotrophomonas pavanii]|uniref:hypothetical protein n=1 Tax=Stenotrophomonas pavanii TaxID=487698 RepID=UPI002DBB3840|nr:hypothetical protein [Stenotrophomonas pavanii]MEC4338608.1 hypothetical protein [Stenotrophomonas pavanii]
MALADTLHKLNEMTSSEIVEAALVHLTTLKQGKIPKEEKRHLNELLLMILIEAEHKNKYDDHYPDVQVEVQELCTDFKWLKLYHLVPSATAVSCEPELERLLERVRVLAHAIEVEQGTFDAEDASYIRSIGQYFASYGALDIALARWLVIVLSLVLHLLKVLRAFAESQKHGAHVMEAKGRVLGLLDSMEERFPQMPSRPEVPVNNESSASALDI